MRDRSHTDVMSEQLRADPAYAAELFADVLRDGSPAELSIILNQISLALGSYDQTSESSVQYILLVRTMVFKKRSE